MAYYCTSHDKCYECITLQVTVTTRIVTCFKALWIKKLKYLIFHCYWEEDTPNLYFYTSPCFCFRLAWKHPRDYRLDVQYLEIGVHPKSSISHSILPSTLEISFNLTQGLPKTPTKPEAFEVFDETTCKSRTSQRLLGTNSRSHVRYIQD